MESSYPVPLADLDWVTETFAHQTVLQVVTAAIQEGSPVSTGGVPVALGLPQGRGAQDPRQAHTRALRATRHALVQTEEFVGRTGRKRMSVTVREYLDRFYIVRYAPASNLLFCQAMLDPLREWLEPVPDAYREWADVVG